MKAITVRQPWAWLLIHGGKDIENRNWPTLYRGPIAIHAAKGLTEAEYQDAVDFVLRVDPHMAYRIPKFDQLERGCVIGTMTMHGCVIESSSPWFHGKYGFHLIEPIPAVNPVYVKGALGLWEWGVPA
jgi:hypothetical protein